MVRGVSAGAGSRVKSHVSRYGGISYSAPDFVTEFSFLFREKASIMVYVNYLHIFSRPAGNIFCLILEDYYGNYIGSRRPGHQQDQLYL